MKNRIISVIAGIIIGIVVVAIGDAIVHHFFPPPANFDFNDKNALVIFIDSLPIMAFVSMLLTWSLSACIGGFVTGKLSKSNWERSSLITGGILLVGNIFNLIMIPHPIWVNVIAVLVYLPLAYLGGKLANPNT